MRNVRVLISFVTVIHVYMNLFNTTFGVHLRFIFMKHS